MAARVGGGGMKQAIRLYTTIKKNQFILALALGVLLAVVSVTSNLLWKNITMKHFSEQFEPVVFGIWIFVGATSVLNDQLKHLDTWLFTQNISRLQLFLTRVILLIVAPILISSLMDIVLTLLTEPKKMIDIISSDATDGVQFFFIASIMAFVYTLIGPIWMKIAAAIFMLVVPISPVTQFEKIDNIFGVKLFEHNDNLQILSANLIILAGAIIIFMIGGYLSTKISVDTVDEAVRIRHLRWPVIIFVFVSMYLTLMLETRSPINSGIIFKNMIIPAIMAVITFAFVFKPTFKLTWDK